MRTEVSTHVLNEPEFAEWNGLVARSDEGSIYSTPEYLDVLCRATGGAFHILAARRGDELVGGVALYERQARPGTFVSPRLLLYYNGILLRPAETKYPSQRTARNNEVLEALHEGLGGLGYGRIELRCRSPLFDVRVLLSRGWNARPQYTYVVPLGDLAALRGRMEQNLRRLVDRCAAQGLTVTEDDDFDAFFRLHAQVHDRKGAKLYLPEGAFRTYFAKLRALGIARLFHARLPDGTSVSAQLTLSGGHPVSHTVAAGSDAAHLKLGATAFLRWNVFERLAALGSTANDLTDAALNPVTHFKAQLGGDLQTCFFLEAPESSAFRRERRRRELRGALGRNLRRIGRRLVPRRSVSA
jgi:Acetyltransferase (GNAT) domain